MQTIYLDEAGLADREQLHRTLKLLLDLPDYYGMHPDALHDCLGERVEPVNLYVARADQSPVAEDLRIVRAVVEDLGGKVTFA